jgi:hypothetical protein
MLPSEAKALDKPASGDDQTEQAVRPPTTTTGEEVISRSFECSADLRLGLISEDELNRLIRAIDFISRESCPLSDIPF